MGARAGRRQRFPPRSGHFRWKPASCIAGVALRSGPDLAAAEGAPPVVRRRADSVELHLPRPDRSSPRAGAAHKQDDVLAPGKPPAEGLGGPGRWGLTPPEVVSNETRHPTESLSAANGTPAAHSSSVARIEAPRRREASLSRSERDTYKTYHAKAAPPSIDSNHS